MEYGSVYTGSTAKKYVSDITFVGTVVGQLAFGYLADHWSRTNSLLLSTVILIVFTALATGSYYHGDAVGMFNILTAWRFFVSCPAGEHWQATLPVRAARLEPLGDRRKRGSMANLRFPRQVGIGIGGEYPAGSVGCAESTGELKAGTRNTWFIMFTNTMIDWVRCTNLQLIESESAQTTNL